MIVKFTSVASLLSDSPHFQLGFLEVIACGLKGCREAVPLAQTILAEHCLVLCVCCADGSADARMDIQLVVGGCFAQMEQAVLSGFSYVFIMRIRGSLFGDGVEVGRKGGRVRVCTVCTAAVLFFKPTCM